MTKQLRAAATVSAVLALSVIATPVLVQENPAERVDMIRTQNALRLVRDFGYDSRHFHFLMTTAIISFEGGWMARDAAEGLSYAENLREVAKSQYLPKYNRLRARLETNKNLDEEEKAKVDAAVGQMLDLVALSHLVAEALDAGDGETANKLFHETAFPNFKDVWATNYTLATNAERRLPRR